MCPATTKKESALERAGRVADFLEFGTSRHDALAAMNLRRHFRENTRRRGEAKRRRSTIAMSRRVEYQGVGQPPLLHKEPLCFEKCI